MVTEVTAMTCGVVTLGFMLENAEVCVKNVFNVSEQVKLGLCLEEWRPVGAWLTFGVP